MSLMMPPVMCAALALFLAVSTISCARDSDGGLCCPECDSPPCPITYPLPEGGLWIYAETYYVLFEGTESRDNWVRTDSVGGPTSFGGEAYHILHTRTGLRKMKEYLIRQVGNTVFRFAAADTSIDAAERQSLPWRFFDFAAAEDSAWVLHESDSQYWTRSHQMQRGDRASVTVPGGSFPDARVFHYSYRSCDPGCYVVDEEDIIFYVVDCVGVVRETGWGHHRRIGGGSSWYSWDAQLLRSTCLRRTVGGTGKHAS